MKIRIFVRPCFVCNVLEWFELWSGEHELHEDFGENCCKHCGGLEKRGGWLGEHGCGPMVWRERRFDLYIRMYTKCRSIARAFCGPLGRFSTPRNVKGP